MQLLGRTAAGKIIPVLVDDNGQIYVISSGGAGVYSSAVLGSAYTIVTPSAIASPSFENTGLSLSIPSAGDWLITVNGRGIIDTDGTATRAFIMARLYNNTAGAAITNSEMMCAFAAAGVTDERQIQFGASFIITTTGAITLNLQAAAVYQGTSPTWVLKQIGSDAYGRTSMLYQQLG